MGRYAARIFGESRDSYVWINDGASFVNDWNSH